MNAPIDWSLIDGTETKQCFGCFRAVPAVDFSDPDYCPGCVAGVLRDYLHRDTPNCLCLGCSDGDGVPAEFFVSSNRLEAKAKEYRDRAEQCNNSTLRYELRLTARALEEALEETRQAEAQRRLGVRHGRQENPGHGTNG